MGPLDTPLHKAVKAGNFQDVKVLILSGIDINEKDDFNRTPLYYAVCVSNDMTSIVNILLQNGADPNTADSNLMTPLHIAVQCEFIEIVKMLIAKNAKINTKNSAGSTPLHLAAGRGHNLELKRA